MKTTILILLSIAAIAATLQQEETHCGITLVNFLGIEQEAKAQFQPTPDLVQDIFDQKAVLIPGIRHRLGSPIRLENKNGKGRQNNIDRILSGSVEKWMDSVLVTWVWTDAQTGKVQKVYSAPYSYNPDHITRILEQSLRDFAQASYHPETPGISPEYADEEILISY